MRKPGVNGPHRRVAGRSGGRGRAVALDRKEQLVAVGIVDLDRVVPPPGFLPGNGTLRDLPAKLREPVHVQFDEEAPFVPARGILAEDDLALAPIDLADGAHVPMLLEAE